VLRAVNSQPSDFFATAGWVSGKKREADGMGKPLVPWRKGPVLMEFANPQKLHVFYFFFNRESH
jgi:hypothetical protein